MANAPVYSDNNGRTQGTAGVVLVNPDGNFGAPSSFATYYISAIGYTAYATPTDLITISGSATKIIRVEFFSMRIQSTSAALQTLYFIKRSTANTGGTATNPTAVLFDSTDAAASAVVNVYTAAPTLGSTAGNAAIILQTSATLTGVPSAAGLLSVVGLGTLAQRYKPVTLRGTAESLCINYNGAALTSGFTACYDIVWTESAT